MRQCYSLRMETGEPVFGQYLLRGLEKVNREWLLICTGHNLLKLFRFGERKPSKARATGPAGNNRDWHGTATRGIFRLLTAYTPVRPSPGWLQSADPSSILTSQLFLGRAASITTTLILAR